MGHQAIMPLSSRGLGHQVFILATRVRIPLGVPVFCFFFPEDSLPFSSCPSRKNMLIRTSRGRRRFPAVMTDSKRPSRFPTGVFPERKLVSGFSAEFLPVRRMRLQRRRFLPVQFPPKTLQHSVPESAGGTRGSRHLPRCASSRF